MKLLGLCSGDPYAPRSYSGSARQLFRALDAEGVLAAALDVDREQRFSWWTRAASLVETGRVRVHRLLGRWTDAQMRARCARAERVLRDAPAVDAALLYGTDFYPARDGELARVPIAATLDTTFAQLARAGEWKFGALTPTEVRLVVERQRRVLERCQRLFPWTEWCARSLVDDYGVPSARLVIVGAGSNLDVPPPPRRGHDQTTILFVGRDWQRKNGPLVLDAFALARETRPELRLIIVGPDVTPSEQDGVEWIGALDGAARRQLPELYARASLLVMPSRFEPFGIAMLEAMSAGTPVIALDRGAAREIVAHGVTGELVADPEPHALAHAMLAWLADRKRLDRAGLAAMARVQREFTWARTARRIVQSLSGVSSLESAAREKLERA